MTESQQQSYYRQYLPHVTITTAIILLAISPPCHTHNSNHITDNISSMTESQQQSYYRQYLPHVTLTTAIILQAISPPCHSHNINYITDNISPMSQSQHQSYYRQSSCSDATFQGLPWLPFFGHVGLYFRVFNNGLTWAFSGFLIKSVASLLS